MVRLFLCGDVMTGRGIDQVLPHPSAPELHESYVADARDYVTLAERRSGRIERPLAPTTIWGEALGAIERIHPDARIINLETSVTRSDAWEGGKGIHYRMHPQNAGVITAAAVDVCGLANNHVLDWGRAGLAETIDVVRALGVATCGAGRDAAEAWSPAVKSLSSHRVVVYALGCADAGVPAAWAAAAHRSGVAHIERASVEAATRLAAQIVARRRAGDIVVVSIHWGSNWGYHVDDAHQRFAHALIDAGAVDVVHGHSSHHPRPIEIHRGRLILYGCGDLINDYEGIDGYEAFRGDLGLLYFATLGDDGALVELRMVPMRMRRLRLSAATEEEAAWLRALLDGISREHGVHVVRDGADLVARATA